MRYIHLILAAAATGVIATPSSAQDSSQQPSYSAAAAGAEARANNRQNAKRNFDNDYNSKVLLKADGATVAKVHGAAMSVAECVAKKAKGEAGALLGGPMTRDPSFEALAKALGTRKYDRCVSQDAVGMPMDRINGALAEVLLRGANPMFEDRARTVDTTAAGAFAKDSNGKTIDSVGRCLAAYSPGLAYRVLLAKSGSGEESAALAAAYAASPECGVAKVPDGIGLDEQRSAIAAGLYHWTHRS